MARPFRFKGVSDAAPRIRRMNVSGSLFWLSRGGNIANIVVSMGGGKDHNCQQDGNENKICTACDWASCASLCVYGARLQTISAPSRAESHEQW